MNTRIECFAHAARAAEQSKIVKLPAGGWRAWDRARGLRGYGTTKPNAVYDLAAKIWRQDGEQVG